MSNLKIEDAIFDDTREHINQHLQFIIKQMNDKDVYDGKVSCTIKIKMRKEVEETTGQLINVPSFEPKVKSKVENGIDTEVEIHSDKKIVLNKKTGEYQLEDIVETNLLNYQEQ